MTAPAPRHEEDEKLLAEIAVLRAQLVVVRQERARWQSRAEYAERRMAALTEAAAQTANDIVVAWLMETPSTTTKLIPTSDLRRLEERVAAALRAMPGGAP